MEWRLYLMKKNNFENFVNPTSVIWQEIQTEYWKTFVKVNIEKFYKETKSVIAEKILKNFDEELKKFKQVCPIEMLDKLDNPITMESNKKKAS